MTLEHWLTPCVGTQFSYFFFKVCYYWFYCFFTTYLYQCLFFYTAPGGRLYMLTLHAWTNGPLSSARTWTQFHHPLPLPSWIYNNCKILKHLVIKRFKTDIRNEPHCLATYTYKLTYVQGPCFNAPP